MLRAFIAGCAFALAGAVCAAPPVLFEAPPSGCCGPPGPPIPIPGSGYSTYQPLFFGYSAWSHGPPCGYSSYGRFVPSCPGPGCGVSAPAVNGGELPQPRPVEKSKP
ncbi:MAG: hypothetical protein K2R98_29915 [Gemmataceae bacterium]|nr:hypothetical protein [Gemmataceae bacterium]